jgi:hypothetical protein
MLVVALRPDQIHTCSARRWRRALDHPLNRHISRVGAARREVVCMASCVSPRLVSFRQYAIQHPGSGAGFSQCLKLDEPGRARDVDLREVLADEVEPGEQDSFLA